MKMYSIIIFIPIYKNHVIVLFKIRNFNIIIQNPILKRKINVIKNHENIKRTKHLITNITNKFIVFYINNN